MTESLVVVALVRDLMDRSKIQASITGVKFGSGADGCTGADVVIVDLARNADAIGAIADAEPSAKILGFGSHVDIESLEAARAAGAHLVLARSQFFRDPLAAVQEILAR
ncbi:MAG: DNA-binding response regulator [Actinomycetes bacterium]